MRNVSVPRSKRFLSAMCLNAFKMPSGICAVRVSKTGLMSSDPSRRMDLADLFGQWHYDGPLLCPGVPHPTNKTAGAPRRHPAALRGRHAVSTV